MKPGTTRNAEHIQLGTLRGNSRFDEITMRADPEIIVPATQAVLELPDEFEVIGHGIANPERVRPPRVKLGAD